MNKLQPYDIILAKAHEPVSNFIGALTDSEWSHSMILIDESIVDQRYKDENPINDKDLLVWESVLSGPVNDGIREYQTNDVFFGVQVRSFKQLFDQYRENKVQLLRCRLKKEYLDMMTPELMKQLFIKYNRRNYETNWLEIFGAVFKCCKCINEKLGLETKKDMFCSEFIAALLCDVGILDTIPSSIVPADFQRKFNDVFEPHVLVFDEF
jgi:hypothetical protein